MKYVDIVLVKSQVDDGKLTTKVDALGNIYLEDTFAGEAVKIGKLPECYFFHTSGKWEPIRVLHDNAEYSEEWFCSNCRRIEKRRFPSAEPGSGGSTWRSGSCAHRSAPWRSGRIPRERSCGPSAGR